MRNAVTLKTLMENSKESSLRKPAKKNTEANQKKGKQKTKPFVSNRKAEQATIVLERSFAHLRLDKKTERYIDFAKWADIVGETIANNASPDRFLGEQTLVVKVRNASWGQELSMQKQELLAKLREGFPNSVISDIRFETASLAHSFQK